MCYNVIYNGVPTYIREYADGFFNGEISHVLIDFTVEDQLQTKYIMDMFNKSIFGGVEAELKIDFTRGHYKRGID